MKICSQCQKTNIDESRFCIDCGFEFLKFQQNRYISHGKAYNFNLKETTFDVILREIYPDWNYDFAISNEAIMLSTKRAIQMYSFSILIPLLISLLGYLMSQYLDVFSKIDKAVTIGVFLVFPLGTLIVYPIVFRLVFSKKERKWEKIAKRENPLLDGQDIEIPKSDKFQATLHDLFNNVSILHYFGTLSLIFGFFYIYQSEGTGIVLGVIFAIFSMLIGFLFMQDQSSSILKDPFPRVSIFSEEESITFNLIPSAWSSMGYNFSYDPNNNSYSLGMLGKLAKSQYSDAEIFHYLRVQDGLYRPEDGVKQKSIIFKHIIIPIFVFIFVNYLLFYFNNFGAGQLGVGYLGLFLMLLISNTILIALGSVKSKKLTSKVVARYYVHKKANPDDQLFYKIQRDLFATNISKNNLRFKLLYAFASIPNRWEVANHFAE